MKTVDIFYQNVRGLKSKTTVFYNNVSTLNSSDIIVLTETFLVSSVHDAELFPPGYVVLRSDRAGDVGWGGVLIAIKDCYSARMLIDIDGLTPDKEILFALITWKNVKFLLCVCYLPPSYNETQYTNVLDCLENGVTKYSTLNVIIIGDFNLNSCSTKVKRQFESFLHFCNLQQHNTVTNNYDDGMLDLALSNIGAENIEVREAVTGALVKADRYHPPLDVVVRLPRGSHIPPPPPPPASCSAAGNFYCASEWNFRKADYLALYEDIMGIDWSAVLRQQDVNSAVHLFYSLLYAVIDRHVPKKRTSRGARRHYPPWYTDEIKRKLVIKYFHLKKYKCLGLEFNSEVYKYYRSHIKDLVDAAYQQYVSDIARD
ncbi:hypothetical protein O0L34_g8806 [Tuta absoluta]|nr:hypothetical protein O0L34_g8806 [Tuta absoluta]